jgi:YD repeat-containing protein
VGLAVALAVALAALFALPSVAKADVIDGYDWGAPSTDYYDPAQTIVETQYYTDPINPYHNLTRNFWKKTPATLKSTYERTRDANYNTISSKSTTYHDTGKKKEVSTTTSAYNDKNDSTRDQTTTLTYGKKDGKTLTSTDTSTWTYAYTYDSQGNVTKKVSTNTDVEYTYSGSKKVKTYEEKYTSTGNYAYYPGGSQSSYSISTSDSTASWYTNGAKKSKGSSKTSRAYTYNVSGDELSNSESTSSSETSWYPNGKKKEVKSSKESESYTHKEYMSGSDTYTFTAGYKYSKSDNSTSYYVNGKKSAISKSSESRGYTKADQNADPVYQPIKDSSTTSTYWPGTGKLQKKVVSASSYTSSADPDAKEDVDTDKITTTYYAKNGKSKTRVTVTLNGVVTSDKYYGPDKVAKKSKTATAKGSKATVKTTKWAKSLIVGAKSATKGVKVSYKKGKLTLSGKKVKRGAKLVVTFQVVDKKVGSKNIKKFSAVGKTYQYTVKIK